MHYNNTTANFIIAGVFTNGGVKPNIIPESSELLYILRAPTETEVAALKDKVVGCIQGAATATGCQVCKRVFFFPFGLATLVTLIFLIVLCSIHAFSYN